MSYLTADGGMSFGSMLQQLLMVDEIEPGSVPSYQLCKGLYLFHPLGLKMAESPIRMAQSQEREISIGAGPKEDLQKAFIAQWREDAASKVIFQHATLARIYGTATIGLVVEDKQPDDLIDFNELHKLKIAFSIFDPLNTSGSLILNQNPMAVDFLKTPDNVRVSGKTYHKSRIRVMMNEQPIYLGYTEFAFGYVGRSVYQRALYPLKSFVSSMVTDDLVTLKAGVLIAKIQQPGSIIDGVMSSIAAVKRMFIKVATTGNVVQIGEKDEITSLNLQNLDAVHDSARKHIIENIATAADMPAKLLLQETFAEGFGEGTEDAKHVARYIDRMREEMDPDYRFMDEIVMHRAWNPDYYETLKAKYPDDFGSKDYRQFFYEAKNSFAAKWPNLLTEPDSEKATAEKAKHDALIGVVETLAPLVKDPENRARLVTWVCDNLNDNKLMFPAPLNFDEQAMIEYRPPAEDVDPGDEKTEPKPPRPLSIADSVSRIHKLAALS